MSKTYCRFCDEHFEGLYLECPDCENWLSPYPKPKEKNIIHKKPTNRQQITIPFGTSIKDSLIVKNIKEKNAKRH